MRIVRFSAAVLFAAIPAFTTATAARAFDPIVSLQGEHMTIHPNGATDEILATKEGTDGKIGILTLSDLVGGGGPGPAIVHANEAEFWYVLEGTYEFHIGDKVVEGGPGTFVAVDAGQPHGFITKTPGKLLVIFTPGGYEQFFVDWEKQSLKPGPELGALEESYGVTRP